MAEADPIAAVRSILLADSGVTGQVSTRVYGDELPGSQNQQMPRKCVVLSYSGGGSLGPWCTFIRSVGRNTHGRAVVWSNSL